MNYSSDDKINEDSKEYDATMSKQRNSGSEDNPMPSTLTSRSNSRSVDPSGYVRLHPHPVKSVEYYFCLNYYQPKNTQNTNKQKHREEATLPDTKILKFQSSPSCSSAVITSFVHMPLLLSCTAGQWEKQQLQLWGKRTYIPAT